MNTEQLRQAYDENPAVAAICDELASRQRRQSTTKLRRMLHILSESSDSPPRKHELIAGFRLLEGLKAGKYVEGRHGHPSRFEWSVDTLEACRAAQGENFDADALALQGSGPNDADDDDEGVLDHYFNLRIDYQLELQLPIDLSLEEADRLATFVRSLPLEDYQ